MKTLYLIGIGTGDPEHLTIQSLNILKKVDVILILDKDSKRQAELVSLRKDILQKYLPEQRYKLVHVKIPERKRGRELNLYKENVTFWRRQKAEILANTINKEIKEGQKAALLIWGDPSLYDGHIEILEYILHKGLAEFNYEIIPGITAMQLLAARHRISLNNIAESILITTGRNLKEIPPEGIKNVVVFLDNYLTYKNFRDSKLHIYWGAYLGTKDEIIISGRIGDVVDEIIRLRTEARKKKGYIMETYILRRDGE
jgi:precorrin-6A synthase